MKTKKLTLSAIMVALAFVLSMIKIITLPNEGSVTAASMVPIIVVSVMFDTKWGILTAFVFSLLQMVSGIPAPPVQNFGSYLLVVLFDYVIAFTVLGFAGTFYRKMGKTPVSLALSGGITVALRFLCHFFSGIIIWGVYAPEGQNPALYSLLYNGSYMGIELIITVAALALLSKFIIKTSEKYSVV